MFIVSSVMRIIFAIKSSIKHKKAISKTIGTKNNDTQNIFSADSIFDIDLKSLKKNNIKVLVLDFDGVLASHGQIKPNKATQNWMHEALKIYPNTTYILSNNPKSKRFIWLNKHFPEIKLVAGVRKKPYPDGLNAIHKDVNLHTKIKSCEIILIDDRLLTGVLASLNAKTKVIYIKKPVHNFKSSFFIQECFFASLRFIERLFLKNY